MNNFGNIEYPKGDFLNVIEQAIRLKAITVSVREDKSASHLFVRSDGMVSYLRIKPGQGREVVRSALKLLDEEAGVDQLPPEVIIYQPEFYQTCAECPIQATALGGVVHQ